MCTCSPTPSNKPEFLTPRGLPSTPHPGSVENESVQQWVLRGFLGNGGTPWYAEAAQDGGARERRDSREDLHFGYRMKTTIKMPMMVMPPMMAARMVPMPPDWSLDGVAGRQRGHVCRGEEASGDGHPRFL